MPSLLRDSRPKGLPANLRHLDAPCYLHHSPRRLLWPMLALALLLALAAVSVVGWQVFQGRAGVAEALLGGFALLFVAILVRPRTWRPHIAMAADRRGLFFVGTSDAEPAVFVPWNEVGPITIERRSVGGGLARTVVLRIDDGSAFWARAKQSRVLGRLIGAPDAEGRRAVPIGNAGRRPEDTREALDALRLPPDGA